MELGHTISIHCPPKKQEKAQSLFKWTRPEGKNSATAAAAPANAWQENKSDKMTSNTFFTFYTHISVTAFLVIWPSHDSSWDISHNIGGWLASLNQTDTLLRFSFCSPGEETNKNTDVTKQLCYVNNKNKKKTSSFSLTTQRIQAANAAEDMNSEGLLEVFFFSYSFCLVVFHWATILTWFSCFFRPLSFGV